MSKIFVKNTPFDTNRNPSTKKIIINSNLYYSKPLELLLSSLIDIGFTSFLDVVIVRGQCEKNEAPTVVKISDITNLNSDSSVVLVNMELNNFDYTGYHALHLYQNDPLISADWYMYVLDTSSFEKYFMYFISNANLLHKEIVVSPCPHSNICAFGNEVIKNYKDNFSVQVNKEEAVRLEFNLDVYNKNIKSILHFGQVIYTDNRKFIDVEDIYGTGRKRHKFYYPYFGINKWILWGDTGDIH